MIDEISPCGTADSQLHQNIYIYAISNSQVTYQLELITSTISRDEVDKLPNML